MQNSQWIFLIIALLALIVNNTAWSRGGHGHGHGHHFSDGHHVGGGHRHFSRGHHHHRHNRLNFGINLGGYYGPGFYSRSYYGDRGYGYRGYGNYGYRSYGYPSVITVPSTPPVYIQRQAAAPEQQKSEYWHYCREPDGYYPYVKQCPGGWLQVAPQPPAQ